MTTKTEASELPGRINQVASGQVIPGTVIYWDSAAVGNEGPSFRDGDESGEINHIGWGGPNVTGTEDDQYLVADYFGRDGSYNGPDCYGVYPLFST